LQYLKNEQIIDSIGKNRGTIYMNYVCPILVIFQCQNTKRVNLSRELNIDEIKALTVVANKKGILTEVFVHGSYCISFSGICYMSSVHGGNSGNRGRCSQPCRDKYVTTAVGINYPLNLKDNSAYF
jgi:putative protease